MNATHTLDSSGFDAPGRQRCVVCESEVLVAIMPLITAASQDAAKYSMMLIREVPSDVTIRL